MTDDRIGVYGYAASIPSQEISHTASFCDGSAQLSVFIDIHRQHGNTHTHSHIKHPCVDTLLFFSFPLQI